MRRFTSLFFLLALCLTAALSVEITPDWVELYNGSLNEADCIRSSVYHNGALYVTGSSVNHYTYPHYLTNIVTLKYNDAGVLQASADFDGPTSWNDEPRIIEADSSGDLIVAGWTEWSTSPNTKNWDAIVLKYDENLQLEWSQQWPGLSAGNTDDELVEDMLIDQNDDIYISGVSVFASTETAFLTKFDTSGTQLWNVDICNGYPWSMAEGLDGSIYVVCETSEYLEVFKYSPSGSLLDSVALGTAVGRDYGGALAVAADGNLYLTCGMQGAEMLDVTTFSLDPSLNILWSDQYDGTGTEYIYGSGKVTDFGHLIEASDGSIYVGAQVVSNGATIGNGHKDFCVIKYSFSGSRLALATFNQPTDDFCLAMELDDEDNVYLTGTRIFSLSGPGALNGGIVMNELVSVAWDENLNELWYDIYDTYNGGAKSISCNPYGDVFICGTLYNSNADYGTLKYHYAPNPGNPLGSAGESAVSETRVRVMNNPVTGDQLAVACDSMLNGDAAIKIYDLSGRLIQQNPCRISNGRTNTISVGGLRSGFYILEVAQESERATCRFIVR